MSELLKHIETKCVLSIECANCGIVEEIEEDNFDYANIVMKKLLEDWKLVLDPKIDDVFLPSCPSCCKN